MPSESETGQSHVISVANSNTAANALILNAGATILPDKLALLVSRLSYVGTLSIRSSALLAEAALEGARIGTITSLEMGRKTLEGLVSSVFDLLVRDSNNFGSTRRGAFGALVEKYSNIGIYLVYHTFTLAELFSMSGFVLAQASLSTGFSVAEESVRFVDLMFGSNETSRALASIVMLVAKELNDEEDKSWTSWLTGGTSTAVLARLTKSATLFACLQHRTFDRSKGDIMGKVLWDVTVASRENEDLLAGQVIQQEQVPSDELVRSDNRISTEIEAPTAAQLDAIDLDDAMTIVDAEEYSAVTSALPPTSLPHSTSTAFYEVTTETTVTKTTTVQFINSSQRDARPVETRALRSRQVNTTTEKSKYKIAVQKVTDKLKVKKLQKPPTTPKITEITEEEQSAMKKAFQRAKRGFSPSSATTGTSAKRQEMARQNGVSELRIPSGKSEDKTTKNAPPIRSRDTKANILRTRAQAKSPEPTELRESRPRTQLVTNPSSSRTGPPLPPRPPPPRNSSLYRPSDRDREIDRIPSPTKLRGRRNSTISISSFLSLRSDSHLHTSLFENTDSRPTNFPPNHLVDNLARFMRSSSASYGWNFMRLLGIGKLSDSGVPVDSLHHANHHAFAQHTNLPLSNILLSSFSSATFGSQTPQLVHFVSVDHEVGAVVLTCRGTLGVADILTDLACDYENIRVYGEEYPVHKGMLSATKQLSVETSKVCKVIKEALETNPGYGLVLCGHSLGGGVAALLAILWACSTEDYVQVTSTLYPPATPFVTSPVSPLPAGRPIHAYAYGTPATVSIPLSRLTRGLITSVVHNWDVVPTLSMGMIRDLRHIAVTLKDNPSLLEESRRKILADVFSQPLSVEDETYLYTVLTRLREEMTAVKLVPPGQVLVVSSEEHFSVSTRGVVGGGTNERRVADVRVVCRDVGDVLERRFGEIWFGKGMFSDHSPKNYEFVLEALRRGVLGRTE